MRSRKAGQPIRSNQAKFVLLAFTAGAFGALDFLPKFGINIYPFGYICASGVLGFIAYAIVAYRLMDVSEMARDSIIHVGASVLLTTGFIIMGVPFVSRFPQPVFIVTMVVVVFSVPMLHKWLSKRLAPVVDQTVFRGKFDYQRKIQELSDRIFSIYDMNELLDTLVQSMAKAIGIDVSCVYIVEKRTGNFELWAHTGIGEETAKECKMLVAGSPFVKVLHKESRIILREDLLKCVKNVMPKNQNFAELDSRLGLPPKVVIGGHSGMTNGGRAAGMMSDDCAGMTAEQKSKSELEENIRYKKAVEEMEDLGCEIAVPLYYAGKMIGVIVLGPKKNKNMYTHKDISLLAGLGRDVSNVLGFVTVIYDQAQVVATTAHDAKQPLNGARMAIANFLQGYYGGLSDEQRQELEYVLKRIDFINNFMMDLVELNDILRRTLRGEYKFESYDLKKVLNDVVDTLQPAAKNKGLKLSLLCGKNLPYGLGVSGSIRRAFSNLVSNAIKFTDSGFVEVSASSDGHNLEVKVTDTGPGMNEEDLKKLFLPFSKIIGQKMNSMDSFGLGLTVVKEVVDIHQGSISVESETGEGTVFTLRLPVKDIKDIKDENEMDKEERQEVISYGKQA